MQIGLADVDPLIAAKLEERLCAPLKEFLKENIHWSGIFAWQLQRGTMKLEKKREPNEDERKAYDLRKQREERAVGRGIFTAFIPVVGGLASGAAFVPVSPAVAVATGVTVLVGGVAAGLHWTNNASPKAALLRSVQLFEMRAVFPLLRLSRAERIYCDALLMLARVEAESLTEGTLRDTLQQLNVLLASSRHLETRRQSLLPIMGLNNPEEIEKEYLALQERLERTTDTLTRQSLEQSLQMCANRRENARNLEQSLERLNVQQEAIVQTLASALSSMARLQMAPKTETVALQITETVTQMNQQTRAVEAAVEEVMTLRIQ